jgi:hypothetical protein
MEQSSNSEGGHIDKLKNTIYYKAKHSCCKQERRGNVSSLTCYLIFNLEGGIIRCP